MEWIKISDRLPENQQDVLFYTKHQTEIRKGFFVLQDEWKRPNRFFGNMGWFSVDDITHWMPLPEPPKD